CVILYNRIKYSKRMVVVMSQTTKSIVTEDFMEESNVHANLSVAQLVEKILDRDEAVLTTTGAVRATTGKYTGRSPKDRFIVRDEVSEDKVDWSAVNQPMDEAHFDKLYNKVIAHLKSKNELFSFKGFAGADENFRLSVEVINEY